MINVTGYVSMPGMGAFIWNIISLIAALVGCFLIHFLFLKKDTEYSNNFLNWLKDFLRFDKILIESLLKISYLFFVIFITLSSFSYIGISFVYFLLYLVFGNLILRIFYELLLIMIMIWKNLTEINKKIK